MPRAEMQRPSRHAEFSTTRWSRVHAAGAGDSEESTRALGWICERYWYPLYAYARRRGSSPQDAEDCVQGFFHDLMERGTFARVKEDGGRFRSFLLGCFRRFVSTGLQRDARKKRGGDAAFVSIDDVYAEERYVREFLDTNTPERDFDRAWALTVFENASRALREECDGRGKVGRFDVLKVHINGDVEAGAIEADAARLGMRSEAFRSLIRRLRVRLRELILREIGRTVACSDDVRDELRHLFSVIGDPGASD